MMNDPAKEGVRRLIIGEGVVEVLIARLELCGSVPGKRCFGLKSDAVLGL